MQEQFYVTNSLKKQITYYKLNFWFLKQNSYFDGHTVLLQYNFGDLSVG